MRKKCLDEICYELDKDTDTLTITYAGNIYNFILKKRSPYLINKLRDKRVQKAVTALETALERLTGLALYLFVFLPILVAIAIVILLIFKVVLYISFSFSKVEIYDQILSIFYVLKRIAYSIFYMIGGVLYIFVFCIIPFSLIYDQLDKVNKYYEDSKCKRCGRDFAYEEFRKPLIKEVSTNDKYEITITRYWRCKYCGDENVIEDTENGLYKNCCNKGKEVYWEKKACKICENQNSLIEYREPDVKEIGGIITTICHYKCSHCGYYEISIQKEDSPPID